MSPKISVLICKNSHEGIRVIKSLIITRSVQSDRHYCKYNNESADEMILPLFLAFLCYCELLWQHFSPVHLKFQLYQLGLNIPSSSGTPTRRSRTGSRCTPARFTIGQHNTSLCIHYSKINVLVPFL
jgi:hypothetical protein